MAETIGPPGERAYAESPSADPIDLCNLSYQTLLEQEGIEPEAPAYGFHPQRRRYKSGFPEREWNNDFGVK